MRKYAKIFSFFWKILLFFAEQIKIKKNLSLGEYKPGLKSWKDQEYNIQRVLQPSLQTLQQTPRMCRCTRFSEPGCFAVYGLSEIFVPNKAYNGILSS